MALLVGISSVALATLIGVPLGLVSGYYGGPVDAVIMRIQDALLACSAVLLALLIIARFWASAINVVLTIAIFFVPRFARLVPESVLALKEREFVQASRAIGASDRRILSRAILPSMMATITVQVTQGIAVAILIESGLSYLGLGIQPPTAAWGNMLQQAHAYLYQAPWFVIATGTIILAAVLVFSLAGDRLREIVDPRLRKL